MKFIHCSDFHLDSALTANFSSEMARERNAELCAAFSRMADYAVEQNVRAVLIAGDLFDTRHVSARTAGFVLDRIRRAEGVDFLYLRGNHDLEADPFSGMELPPNLKLFAAVWQSYRYGDVVISGIEMTRENAMTLYDNLKLKAEDTNIVLLHGQITSQPGEDCVVPGLLRGKHIAYLALGHIHSFRQQELEPGVQWCYCGCPEGRGFDECGEKGFVLLETADGSVRSTFVPFAARAFREVEVDITGLHTAEEIRTAMERCSTDVPPGDLVKFILRGSFETDTQKDIPFLLKMLEGRFCHVKIADESRLRIDPMEYRDDISLKGEFIRLVMASDRTDGEKERIILAGLRALRGEAVLP